MKLYFVRHGESDHARLNIHQAMDARLSELGRKQAEFLGKRLSKIKFDLIYSSPFPRARETAKIINKHLDLPLEIMDNLGELRRPSAQEGISKDSVLTSKIRQLASENINNPDWKYEDGESLRQVWDRAKKTTDLLINKHVDQTILIVSHGNFLRTFLARAMMGDVLDMPTYYIFRKDFLMDNTGVSHLMYTPEDGWKVVFWNDLSHIESPDDMTR